MVFRFHPDDTAEFASLRTRPRSLDGLEALLVAHADGAHFVALTHAQARAAAGLPLSARAQRGLAAARELASYAIPGGRPTTVRLGAPVAADWDAKVAHIDEFATMADAAPTRLVAEGEHDLYIYAVLAQDHIPPDVRRIASIALEPVLAAGGNFPHVWERLAAATSRPMIGIVDSDAKDPRAKTATNASVADRRAAPGNRVLIVLRARELENLLPRPLAEAAYEGDSAVLQRIQIAGSSVGAGGNEDMKDLVAREFARRAAEWLKARGASREARRRALSGRCVEADELAALVGTWGLAAVRSRV